MSKRVLFARVGYMKFYSGPQTGDEKPRHGGAYNVDNIGYELYNFKPAGGYVYGFFQPYQKRETDKPTSLNLKRIDPTARVADSINDVLVIFVARSDDRGQVVVGWYDKAMVYRWYQEPTAEMQRDHYSFLVKARSQDAVLLPERYRMHHIPRGAGALGQANVVYPFESDGDPRDFRSGEYSWIGEALTYVRSYDGPNLVPNPLGNVEDKIEGIVEDERIERSGQGFRVGPEQRKMIEAYAMERAKEHFESMGYVVKDVARARSYDLECRKGDDVLRVEVKGTQTDGTSVVLTPNEVASARSNSTALFILHSVGWLGTGEAVRPTGGQPRVLNPWQVETHGRLKALSYMYEIGTGGTT